MVTSKEISHYKTFEGVTRWRRGSNRREASMAIARVRWDTLGVPCGCVLTVEGRAYKTQGQTVSSLKLERCIRIRRRFGRPCFASNHKIQRNARIHYKRRTKITHVHSTMFYHNNLQNQIQNNGITFISLPMIVSASHAEKIKSSVAQQNWCD